jgi:hypothetical protein
MSLPNKACNVTAWANQYYRRQREKGKSHHSAIRALAFKWIRIIWACWKPTSLTMNLSTFTPLKNAILPSPQLDGPPQTLEGAHAQRGKQSVYAGLRP